MDEDRIHGIHHGGEGWGDLTERIKKRDTKEFELWGMRKHASAACRKVLRKIDTCAVARRGDSQHCKHSCIHLKVALGAQLAA